jgi:hypothetical protein
MRDGDSNPVPGLNGFGTGCRFPSGHGAPEPTSDCAPLSADCQAYRMANSPARGHASIASILTRTPLAMDTSASTSSARASMAPRRVTLSTGAWSRVGVRLAAGVIGRSQQSRLRPNGRSADRMFMHRRPRGECPHLRPTGRVGDTMAAVTMSEPGWASRRFGLPRRFTAVAGSEPVETGPRYWSPSALRTMMWISLFLIRPAYASYPA